MKLFLRIISIIIEIIVAIAIFIMITQKTPLFDRAIPWRSSWLSSDLSTKEDWNNKIISNNNIQTWTLIDNNIWSSQKNIILESEVIIDQRVESWLSCKTPRWSIINDNNSVIAYKSQKANIDNKCYSEIRTCMNWRLWGDFIYQTCDYIIDGQLIKSNWTREDVIIGASNSNQTLINLNNFYKKVESTPKQYIQPQPYKDSKTLTISQARSQKMNNSKIIVNKDITDVLDQTTVQDDHTVNKESCVTPRWKKVDHWSFVYAYNIPNNNIWQSCIAQKRVCSDWILEGSYKYQSCSFNTNNYKPQAIIYTTPSKKYNWTISPYSSYVRPISDSISDTLLRSHKQINNSSTTQNHIEVSNCITPWWSVIPNGWRITAYRLPKSTSNSLCDSENRTCRSGTLWWTYTYSSCIEDSNIISENSHETWIEKNIKSIEKDADNVRWWIKWWFK